MTGGASTSPDQDEWQVVPKGRRSNKVQGTSAMVVFAAPTHKPVKQVTFATTAEQFSIEDDGNDDYTFDNVDESGRPRVCTPSKQRLGPPPRRTSSTVATIWAHHRAILWVTGGLIHDLPEARIIGHSGRQAQFAVDPDDNLDVEFVLEQDELAQNFPNYSFKELAIWDAESVCYLDDDSDGVFHIVCDSPEEGLQNLSTRWHTYYHCGEVPSKPVVGASTNHGLAGAAARGKIIEWIVDSGAGMELANKHVARDVGAPIRPDTNVVIGVGGPETTDGIAAFNCRELGVILEPVLNETPFNLISMNTLCKQHKMCFIWLGDLDFPPYILLPGRKFAVVLKVKDVVRISGFAPCSSFENSRKKTQYGGFGMFVWQQEKVEWG